MDPIEIVFRFLAAIFWFLAIGSPIGLVSVFAGLKFCDKVVVTVVSCTRERRTVSDADGTSSVGVFAVTYAYEYNGAPRTVTVDKMRPKIPGSREGAYINPKKPDIVIFKDTLRAAFIIFVASGIGSPLALIYFINPLLANM
jgi:hypothetical protein